MLPTITVVVLNHNGRDDLEQCFGSLMGLDYPSDRRTVMLVDNGSTDDSVDFVRTNHPDVEILRLQSNLGFGFGNNAGARAAQSQYVVFLNSDIWVDRRLLRGFLDALAARPSAVAAGAKILNLDGTAFDFAGAAMHFSGIGIQEAFGAPYDDERFTEVTPILFACGGAMIVDRETFLDAGGFDGDFFAFYEDSDLGWRLWLLGHEVVFAPRAVVYHRHHGTARRFARHRKEVLYKRNALASSYKNYGDENVGRVLAAAISGIAGGVVERAAELRRLDPAAFAFTSGANSERSSVEISLEEAAALVAIRQFTEQLPKLREKRRDIQRRRRRSDEELAQLFHRPFGYWQDVAAATQTRVVEGFDVDELFGGVPRRVLVISSDILPFPGLPTVGSGLRAWSLGEGLRSYGHEVVFSMPDLALREDAEIPTEARDLAWGKQRFAEVIARSEADIVIFCNWPMIDGIDPAMVPIPMILDQHGPHLLERRYSSHGEESENMRAKLRALAKADYFTCAGERQLAYFEPLLKQAGWTDQDCSTRTAAIPVSLAPDPPRPDPAGELVFVYGGVFLPWQDPSSALVEVVEELDRRGHGKLRIFGGRHPLYEVDSGVFDQLISRLDRSGHVVFEGMVDHQTLIEQYRRAHVAVDLMSRNPERELAFTTRTVEYLWCGLPVIYNDYSELSDHIRRYDAGWTIDPDDVEALRAVLAEIFTERDVIERKSRNAQSLAREELNWARTAGQLDSFVRHGIQRAGRAPYQPGKSLQEPSTLEKVRWVYRKYGVRGVARNTVGVARRRLFTR